MQADEHGYKSLFLTVDTFDNLMFKRVGSQHYAFTCLMVVHWACEVTAAEIRCFQDKAADASFNIWLTPFHSGCNFIIIIY